MSSDTLPDFFGVMCTIGELQPSELAEVSNTGFIVQAEDGQLVAVHGLTRLQVMQFAPLFLDRVAVTVNAATEADSAVPSSHVSGTDQPKESGESILREALARLVALKDLKERADDDYAHHRIDSLAWRKLHAEYERGKPLAWEAARSALAGIPK